MKTFLWRRPNIITIILISFVAFMYCFTSNAYASPSPNQHQQVINDNLQILLYVARYRDGDIANQALDAAIHVTGKTDPKEEAFAKSLSDKDIHKIIRECERSKLNIKMREAWNACKPILYLSVGLLVLMKFL